MKKFNYTIKDEIGIHARSVGQKATYEGWKAFFEANL